MMNYDDDAHRHRIAAPAEKRPARWIAGSRAARAPKSDASADRAFLDANRAELAQHFPDEFVAVVNGALVDHDRRLFPLGERVRERTGCDGGMFWFTGARPPKFSRDGKQLWP